MKNENAKKTRNKKPRRERELNKFYFFTIDDATVEKSWYIQPIYIRKRRRSRKESNWIIEWTVYTARFFLYLYIDSSWCVYVSGVERELNTGLTVNVSTLTQCNANKGNPITYTGVPQICPIQDGKANATNGRQQASLISAYNTSSLFYFN